MTREMQKGHFRRRVSIGVDSSSGSFQKTQDIRPPDGSYRSGTDPLNLNDVLKITNPTPEASSDTLRFPTVVGKTYIVEWSLDLNQAWQTLTTVSGTGGEVTVTDTGAIADQRRFYRIRLGP